MQVGLVPRSLDTQLRPLLSLVNRGAAFSEGAVWARFDSRRVAEGSRRNRRPELAELAFEAWRLSAPVKLLDQRGDRLPV